MSNLQTLHTERLHRSALRCIWSPGPNAGAPRPSEDLLIGLPNQRLCGHVLLMSLASAALVEKLFSTEWAASDHTCRKI